MIYTVLILMVRTVTRGRGGGVGQLHIEGEGVYDNCTEKVRGCMTAVQRRKGCWIVPYMCISFSKQLINKSGISLNIVLVLTQSSNSYNKPHCLPRYPLW